MGVANGKQRAVNGDGKLGFNPLGMPNEPFGFSNNAPVRMSAPAWSETAFEVVKRYKVADQDTWSQPAISGNRIFIKDVSTLTLWTLS